MKRILIVISNFNGVGGAETATYRFLSRIDRNKFKIDVCFFGYEDEFVLAVKSFVNDVFCIDVKKYGHGASFIKILKRVRTEKYEMVHTHLALADIYGSFLSFLAPVKWISTEHNLSDRRKTTALGKIYYRLAGWKIHFFVGVSSKIISWLKSTGVSEKKLILIPNPIELARSNRTTFIKSDFLRDYGWPKDSVIIGTVANLRPVKGLQYLIDSVKILVDGGLAVRLVVAGEGPERSNLESRIVEIGLTDHVKLLGYRKDFFSMLPLFDIYVSPSVMEGFGISIVEAMSWGLPVVSTKVGGVTDYLEHMKNSYLVRPRDPYALAGGIGYLIGHKEEAAKLGERAFQDTKHFETGHLVKYVEQLYLGEPQSFQSVKRSSEV